MEKKTAMGGSCSSDNKTCCSCISTSTTTSSTYRSFFQPLLPSFLNTFCIPKSYVKHLEVELKGRPLESIVLVRENEPQQDHWPIKIKGGRHFTEGWKNFAIDNDLQVGDFLVFTHQTHFLFRVSVFDPLTACDRDRDRRHACLQLPDHAHAKPKPQGSKTKRNGKSKLSKKRQGGRDGTTTTKSIPASASASASASPSCVVKITDYSVRASIVHLPRGFVRVTGLANRTCDVMLINGKGKSWTVKLSYRKCNSQSYLLRGWRDFQVSNSLRPKQFVRFQLLQAGKRPVLKCCRLRKPSKASCL